MRATRAKDAIPPLTLQEIAALVEEYSGLALEEIHSRALEAAVAGRIEATASNGVPAYLALLRRARSGELRELVESVANAETAFFRNLPHLRVLKEVVLPGLLGRSDRVLLWSAGCSTGEEAYSLAIACLEVGLAAAADVRVLGTDISRSALAAAERGEYGSRRLANVEPAIRERYFTRSQKGWRITEEVRSLVSWSYHNLVSPELPVLSESVDVLLCQNVTIYFRPPVIREVVGRLVTALKVGGFLLPGFSETLWCRAPGLEMISFGDCFAYRREVASAAPSRALPQGGRRTGAIEPPNQEASRQRATPAPMPSVVIAPEGEAPADPFPMGSGSAGASPSGIRRYHGVVATTDAPPAAPEGGEAMRLLAAARAAASEGRTAEAVDAAGEAVKADPMLAEAWELLGLLQRQSGRGKEAEHAFRRQLYLDLESPLPHFHLATLFREGDRVADAVREYARAARILEAMPPGTLLSGVSADLMLRACLCYGAERRSRSSA